MNELTAQPDNSREKVEFRQKMMALQEWIPVALKPVELRLEHFFVPRDEKYGCCQYARAIFLPKGSVVVGKIHRHQHLNFVMAGKVAVVTEFGQVRYQAPTIFVSEIGTKRAVVAEEDAIWATVHLTEHSGEENLDKIEDEVVAPNYSDLGLVGTLAELGLNLEHDK